LSICANRTVSWILPRWQAYSRSRIQLDASCWGYYVSCFIWTQCSSD
jgi:hypothetical protein